MPRRTIPAQQTRLPDAINASKSRNFTQIPNDFIRNPSISAKAKTVLCLLLSNQSGWTSHITTLAGMMAEGQTAIKSALRELEGAGYLLRVAYRDKQTKKRKGSFWAYTDAPGEMQLDEQIDALDKQGMEAVIESQKLEASRWEPEPGNRALIILKNNNNKNRVSNETLSTNVVADESDLESEKKTPSNLSPIIPSQFNFFYQMYPVKRDKAAALRAWNKACKLSKQDRPTLRQIKIAIREQTRTQQWTDGKIPYPATWLNGFRWLDDPEEIDEKYHTRLRLDRENKKTSQNGGRHFVHCEEDEPLYDKARTTKINTDAGERVIG